MATNAMDTQLIEQMCRSYYAKSVGSPYSDHWQAHNFDAMQAAAEVQQKYILDAIGEPVTDVEWYGCEVRRCPTRETINILLASRVSKYTAPRARDGVSRNMWCGSVERELGWFIRIQF